MVERVKNLKSLEESANTTWLYFGWISAFIFKNFSDRKSMEKYLETKSFSGKFRQFWDTKIIGFAS